MPKIQDDILTKSIQHVLPGAMVVVEDLPLGEHRMNIVTKQTTSIACTSRLSSADILETLSHLVHNHTIASAKVFPTLEMEFRKRLSDDLRRLAVYGLSENGFDVGTAILNLARLIISGLKPEEWRL